eukprot:SAG25_NODE_211_length_11820_cov_9.700793_3_plen_138_part_00
MVPVAALPATDLRQDEHELGGGVLPYREGLALVQEEGGAAAGPTEAGGPHTVLAVLPAHGGGRGDGGEGGRRGRGSRSSQRGSDDAAATAPQQPNQQISQQRSGICPRRSPELSAVLRNSSWYSCIRIDKSGRTDLA